MASDKAQKTYKREASFAIMAVEIGLIIGSAITGSKHMFHLAEFLMPFASGLLMAAFGADWWSRQKVTK
jgi:hypothetical protein